MGKKRGIIIPPSKISKKETSQTGCNINSLGVKVVRPMVYITDSSSFKSLVQELTGNSIGRMVQKSQFPNTNYQLNQGVSVTNQAKVIHNIEEDPIEEYFHQEASIRGSSSSSLSSSLSLDSSKDDLTQLLQLDHHHHHLLLQTCTFEDTTSYDQSLSVFSPSMEVGDLDCQLLDVEALLLDPDLEENPFFAGYNQYHQEEVSLCDYEFSGLL